MLLWPYEQRQKIQKSRNQFIRVQMAAILKTKWRPARQANQLIFKMIPLIKNYHCATFHVSIRNKPNTEKIKIIIYTMDFGFVLAAILNFKMDAIKVVKTNTHVRFIDCAYEELSMCKILKLLWPNKERQKIKKMLEIWIFGRRWRPFWNSKWRPSNQSNQVSSFFKWFCLS